jgi:hypothetical protein
MMPTVSATVTPTWNIQAVKADQFWSATNYRGENIRIAIVDSGVNYNLPDLDGNYLGGYDFVNNDTDPMDDNGHGTECAAIAVGEGDYGYVGVAPKAKYFALKVSGSDAIPHTEVVDDAIDWAVNNGVDVISMSFGWYYSTPQVESACNYALSKNITIVAATGNDANAYPSYPAGYGSVVAVGACKQNLAMWPLSNQGCDLVAPGSNVPTLDISGNIVYKNGTSLACPHVAGAAALWMSRFGKWAKGKNSADEVRQILKISATPLSGYSDWRQGAGLLNCVNTRYQRGFIRNSGFETTESSPWQLDHSGNIIYELSVVKNNYPNYDPLQGDCHLKMKLSSTTSGQPYVWVGSTYDRDNSTFLVDTCERGNGATRNLDAVFEVVTNNVGACQKAKVSISMTFYLSPTTKHIYYCWYARGSDTNTTDDVYISMGALGSANVIRYLSRDIRNDFYNAFHFQLNGTWQIVQVMNLIEVFTTSPSDTIEILTGEVRLRGNYANVKIEDINNDEVVDLKDLYQCGKAYGSTPGTSKWDPRCDVNQDLSVELRDYYAIAKAYGDP